MDFLPDEVLALVLLFLGVRGRGAAAQTSRLWRAILGDAALFRWTCDECQRTYPRLEPSCEAPWYREWGRLCGQCATRPDVLQALGESFRGLRVYWKCCRPDLISTPDGPAPYGCNGHLYPNKLGRLDHFIVVCPAWEKKLASPPLECLMDLFGAQCGVFSCEPDGGAESSPCCLPLFILPPPPYATTSFDLAAK